MLAREPGMARPKPHLTLIRHMLNKKHEPRPAPSFLRSRIDVITNGDPLPKMAKRRIPVVSVEALRDILREGFNGDGVDCQDMQICLLCGCEGKPKCLCVLREVVKLRCL